MSKVRLGSAEDLCERDEGERDIHSNEFKIHMKWKFHGSFKVSQHKSALCVRFVLLTSDDLWSRCGGRYGL